MSTFRAIASKGALVSTLLATGVASVAYASSEDHVEPPFFPWSHNGYLSTFDAKSIRRGHLVYTQVCASCHGLSRIAFRNLVGVCYSEEEAKALAANIDYVDGPNESGEMFDRPGKLSDHFKNPYPNEEAARAANGGALPPDLSLIVKARGRGADYIASLLMGYETEDSTSQIGIPAGVTVPEGQFFNRYFPGMRLSMPPPLLDEAVEFPDGTPATVSQMAKDVSTFLAWASEPEHDDRKRMGLKWLLCLGSFAAMAGYYKRFRWAPIKNRRLSFKD